MTPTTGQFIDFEGTNTTVPTTTTLSNAAKGLNVGAGTAIWQVSNTHSSLTYATAGQLATFVNNIFVNGPSYSGTGSTGLQYLTGTGGDFILYTFGGSFSTVSTSYYFETDLPANDPNTNAYSLNNLNSATAGTDECNAQIVPTGSALTMSLESPTGAPSGTIPFTRVTPYQVQMKYSDAAGGCSLAMLASDWAGCFVRQRWPVQRNSQHCRSFLRLAQHRNGGMHRHYAGYGMGRTRQHQSGHALRPRHYGHEGGRNRQHGKRSLDTVADAGHSESD